jgi:hypothetical protein
MAEKNVEAVRKLVQSGIHRNMSGESLSRAADRGWQEYYDHPEALEAVGLRG